MKSGQTEHKLDTVLEKATQTGEVRDRWSWTEPSVWTDCMLTALEKGVRGGIWYSMMDKVYRPETLYRSFAKVKARKGSSGVDNQTIAMFEIKLDKNLRRLSDTLKDGSYRPNPVKRVWIPKPGKKGEKRPLGIPTVRDRVVQTALQMVLEPVFEQGFAEVSFGFRPGRGCKDALREVQDGLNEGYTFVVDADLKSYFDTIDPDILMLEIRKKTTDGGILKLLNLFLSQRVMDGIDGWTPERGTPQGAVISPLLANIFLNPLDWKLVEGGFKMVRYADDFVILCKDEQEAYRALSLVQEWVETVGLTLHPEKTCIVNEAERGGFDFLGYHFECGCHWSSKKSLSKFKDKIRALTKRCNGYSLNGIIERINPILRGWFEYFKHIPRRSLRALDGWIRMRLRSILRKRIHLRGRGRGRDHQRWPNLFFAAHELFSLLAAHITACQSVRR